MRVAMLLAMAAVFAGVAEARELKDVTGARVVLKDRPARVVTLAPSLGELAADLLGGDAKRIVGVSEYTDFPVSLKKVESIGPYVRVNLEKIVSLKPDLVLATLDGNPKDQVLHLRELGIPVVLVNTGSLSQVEESIRLVAEALGEGERGKAMALKLSKGIAEFKARARKRPPRKVLLQIGDNPLIGVGGGTFLHDAVGAVGASNIYADSPARYPRPSVEDVLKRDPEVILVLTLGGDPKIFAEMAQRWKEFGRLSAVRAGAVRIVEGDTVVRPTLRLLQGLKLLEQAIYGGS